MKVGTIFSTTKRKHKNLKLVQTKAKLKFSEQEKLKSELAMQSYIQMQIYFDHWIEQKERN